MDRRARNRPTTLELRLYADDGETLRDALGDVLVTVTRDSTGGTVTADAVAERPSEGVYQLDLPPADLAELDVLQADWLVTEPGTVGASTYSTYHEVVGRHWFDVANLRDLQTLGSPTQQAKYGSDLLQLLRDVACSYVERVCGVAFTPRYGHDRITGRGSPIVTLDHVRVRRVRSLSIAPGYGTELDAFDAEQIAGLGILPGGALERWRPWPERRTIDVVYEHGHDDPPAEAIRAAQLLTRRLAIATAGESQIDDRARSISTDSGTIDLVIASGPGAPTDVPEVNAILERLRER